MYMRPPSTIVKYLDQDAIDIIHQELLENKDSELWAHHSGPNHQLLSEKNKYTGLRHGKTFWLYFRNNLLDICLDQTQYFPKSINIIKDLAGPNCLGRTYWHNLGPGLSIDEHVDKSVYFDKVLHRYQIYLTLPTDMVMFFDGKLQDPNKFKNCILDFNFSLPHYYKNISNTETVVLLVADVMNFS